MKLEAKLDLEAGGLTLALVALSHLAIACTASLPLAGQDVSPGTSLDVLSDRKLGWYARARRFEIAAALNRLRTMQFRSMATPPATKGKDAW
jgi:hypothetical protein